MKKKAVSYSLVTIICGIISAVLRIIQLNTVIDSETGLAKQGAFISIAIIIVVAFIALIALIKSMGISRMTNPSNFFNLFYPQGKLAKALYYLCGGVFMAAGCYGIGYNISRGELNVLWALLFISTIAVGWAIIYITFLLAKKQQNKKAEYISIISIAFACLLIICVYKEDAANPVRIDYVYRVLACCCVALFTYYSVGTMFGGYKPGRFLFFSQMGAVLCIMSIWESSLVFKVIFATCALWMIVSTNLYVSNLDEKYKPIKRTKTDADTSTVEE